MAPVAQHRGVPEAGGSLAPSSLTVPELPANPSSERCGSPCRLCSVQGLGRLGRLVAAQLDVGQVGQGEHIRRGASQDFLKGDDRLVKLSGALELQCPLEISR
jgi:hypothetical protein